MGIGEDNPDTAPDNSTAGTGGVACTSNATDAAASTSAAAQRADGK